MKDNQKIVSPWHPKTAEWITPDTEVWVCTLFTKDFPEGLICDRAYLSETDMRHHFWFSIKPSSKVQYKAMPFSEYLELHIKECKGMNPFWAVGRLEFLTEYNRKWTKN